MLPETAAPEGTRFLRWSDWATPFEMEGALRGRVSFEEFCEFHAPARGTHTLLRVYEGQIAAAICFEVRANDLFVHWLARNALFRPRGKVRGAAVLMWAAEGFAVRLGREWIRLESVDDAETRAWYRQAGFVEESGPFPVEGWGILHPMAKRVASPGPW